MKPASVIVPSILTVVAAASSTASAEGAPVLHDSAERVLVLSDRPEGSTLVSTLTQMGYQAEKRAVLPEDLSGYAAVWHVSVSFAPTAIERDRLVEFLGAGGGVLLTGERSCCEGPNERIETLVNQVVDGGGIEVGGLGDHMAAEHWFQPEAIGRVAASPYALAAWAPAGTGALGGVGDRNVLTRTPDGVPTSAVWDKHDLPNGGQLAVMMDVNWYDSDPRASELITNLFHFLVSRPVSCGDGLIEATEQCDDANGIDEDDCLSSCEIPSCGDGIVYAGVEQCDDAGNADGDGCSAGCEVEVDAGNVDGIGDIVGVPAGNDDPGNEVTLDDDVDGTPPSDDEPADDDEPTIEDGGCSASGGSGSAATLVLVLGAAIAATRRAGGRSTRRS
jgi:cysteine-rich repeat protein